MRKYMSSNVAGSSTLWSSGNVINTVSSPSPPSEPTEENPVYPDCSSLSTTIYKAATPQYLSATTYTKEILYHKWIINDAKQILFDASEYVKSPVFELHSVGSFSLTAKWHQRNVKITLNLPDKVLWLSGIEFSISDCLSERVVQTKDKKTSGTTAESCICFISIPENEKFDNYVKHGNMTIKVKATITLISDPVRTSSKSLPVPTDDFRMSVSNLFEEQSLTDVSIEVGEKTFKAHKVILASQSDVFRRMFETDMKEKKEGVVCIPDITAEAMEDLLAYFYTGSAKHIGTLARELLVAASKYNITRLRVMCENELKTNLTCENVTSTLLIADKLQLEGDSTLKEECIKFIKKHAESVMKTSTWTESEHEISKDIYMAIAMQSMKI